MTDRDRLIEILKVPIHPKIGVDPAEVVADYLLANGVFLLPEDLRGTQDFSISAFIEAMQMYKEKDRYIKTPCKVGDKVWNVYQRYNGTYKIREGKISMLQQKADKSLKFRITVNSSVWDVKVDEIGAKYFLTKEEAEEKLKELGK